MRSSHAEVATLLASLSDSEARLRGFMDNAPLAMSLKDRAGRYLMVNNIGAKHFGVPPEQLLGGTDEQRGRWADETLREAVAAHEADVLSGGRALTRERIEPRMDGPAHLSVTKFPVLDVNGAVVGVGTVESDVTEQKMAERALHMSTRRFRDFAESSSDWFWEMDQSLNFTSISEREQDLLDDAMVQELKIGRAHV